MSAPSPLVQELLERYERSRNSFDLGLIESLYAETLMFAGPGGVKVVEKSAILASVQKGLAFLTSLGHTSTTLASSSETRLDDHYAMVRARFVWRFEKAPADPIDVDLDAAFMLFIKEGVPRIVFQQEHEDFPDALRARGVLPPPR